MRDPSRNLDEYVSFVRSKLRQDKDNFIIVGGSEGGGKSAFGLLLCNAISPENFILREHTAYETSEFIRRIRSAPRYGSVLGDEGAEIFLSNDANTIDGRNTKKALTQSRRLNLNVVMLSPRQIYLNKMGFFRAHAFFWIYDKWINGKVMRGFGIKYDPEERVWQDGKRPWFDKRFQFRFPDVRKVDAAAWEEYLALKNPKADERMDRYADEIDEENKPTTSMDAADICGMVESLDTNEQFSLRNTRGRFDDDMIYDRFRHDGATVSASKVAAMQLNGRYALE